MVMVLPSEAAVDALKEEVFEVESGDASIPEDGPLPLGSPPRASFLTQSKARPLHVWGAVLPNIAKDMTDVSSSCGKYRVAMVLADVVDNKDVTDDVAEDVSCMMCGDRSQGDRVQGTS